MVMISRDSLGIGICCSSAISGLIKFVGCSGPFSSLIFLDGGEAMMVKWMNGG